MDCERMMCQSEWLLDRDNVQVLKMNPMRGTNSLSVILDGRNVSGGNTSLSSGQIPVAL